MSLKRHFPDIRFGGNRVSPDEMDMYQIVQVTNPSISATWFGTAAAGTAGQARTYVVINRYADWPRNVAASITGSADMGATWVINGKDQFGNAQSETITIGTTANGGTTVGTKVFSEIATGTATVAATGVGSGTPRLGVDLGATTVLFGLPYKIKAVTDVKFITYIVGTVATTMNGGSVTSAHVSTAAHAFRGSATVAADHTIRAWVKTSYPTEDVNVITL